MFQNVRRIVSSFQGLLVVEDDTYQFVDRFGYELFAKGFLECFLDPFCISFDLLVVLNVFVHVDLQRVMAWLFGHSILLFHAPKSGQMHDQERSKLDALLLKDDCSLPPSGTSTSRFFLFTVFAWKPSILFGIVQVQCFFKSGFGLQLQNHISLMLSRDVSSPFAFDLIVL